MSTKSLLLFSLAVNYLFLTDDGRDKHPELTLEPFNATHEQNDYEVNAHAIRSHCIAMLILSAQRFRGHYETLLQTHESYTFLLVISSSFAMPSANGTQGQLSSEISNGNFNPSNVCHLPSLPRLHPSVSYNFNGAHCKVTRHLRYIHIHCFRSTHTAFFIQSWVSFSSYFYRIHATSTHLYFHHLTVCVSGDRQCNQT